MFRIDPDFFMVSSLHVIATYVHNLDPVLFELTESIKLRWYGLAYLAAFLGGYLLLKHLGNKKLWVLPGVMAADFIASAAFFGVFIGGRLGHVLFYHIPAHGWGWVTEDPLMPVRVWEGGMASHGGILGLMIFTFFYCKKMKVSWTGLGDGLCVVAPLGLMFGRLANFINGELYGRVTNVSWGMKFPGTLYDSHLQHAEFGKRGEVFNQCIAVSPELGQPIPGLEGQRGGLWIENFGYMMGRFREDDTLRGIAANYLEVRHPSQLYEAFFEGALLLLILWVVRMKFPRLRHGILTGLFFILYAFARIFCEFFREREEESLELLSRGQFLSLFMVVIGMAFIIWGAKKGGNVVEDRGAFDKREKEKC